MVNRKRVEQKLSCLVTDGPWYSNEFDRNNYRMSMFKRRCPERYNLHKDKIVTELEALQREMNDAFKRRR